MGKALSTLTGSDGRLKSQIERECSSDEDDNPSPAKRRRTSDLQLVHSLSRLASVSPRSPLRQVTNNEARPQGPPRPQTIDQTSFYGKGQTAIRESLNSLDHVTRVSQGHGINKILPARPVNFKKAMRIDVTTIRLKSPVGHESLAFMGDCKGPKEDRILCTVALFRHATLGDPYEPSQTELFRDAQPCILRSEVSNDGVVTRTLISPGPFVINASKIYFERRKLGYNDFADSYSLQVSLSTDDDCDEWLPFDLPSTDDSEPGSVGSISQLIEEGLVSKGLLSLSCLLHNILDTTKQSRALKLRWSHGQYSQATEYTLQVDVNWSIPNSLSLPKAIAKIELPVETPPASPRKRDLSEMRGEEGAAESPSRAKRHRSNIPRTYNLKMLSAQAQGRIPKLPTLKSSGEPELLVVVYAFERAETSHFGIKSNYTVWGLACPFCSCDHDHLSHLRLHLLTNHHHFTFTISNTPDFAKTKFLVKLAKPSHLSSTIDQRTFQLGKAQTLFQLEKFLDGDQSWIRSRHGPSHGQWPDHLKTDHESSSSPSPYDSRQSSPNTSNGTDGVSDDFQAKPVVSKRRRLQVPLLKHNKAVFDRVTHRLLEPGEDIPSSDDEEDEGWINQMHKDIIEDYTDVHPDEKDYIFRWNPFIMEMHLTSVQSLPDAILRFVEVNENWFLEKASRIGELYKHTEALLLRGVISQDCCTKTTIMMRRAEETAKARLEANAMDIDEFEKVEETKTRGALDCICGAFVPPGERLACRGRNCKARFFHRKCMKDSKRPTNVHWLCDSCVR